MKKFFYGLLILLALVALSFTVVLADSDCPPTDNPPQPPPVETVEPPTAQPPPTETRLPPPTETSVPPPTDTPIPPTDEPTSPPEETPFSEPTPTIEIDPTPTETVAPGVTVTTEKHKKPTAVETLPVTGGGLPSNIALGLTSVGIISMLGIAVIARMVRNGQ